MTHKQRQPNVDLDALQKEHCGHGVPANPYGFGLHHTKSNRPIPKATLTILYDKVLGPVHKTTVEELRADLQSQD